MDKDELFEDIRTRLREAQENVCSSPWLYSDEDLVKATRAALRHLRSIGVTALTMTMDLSGNFDAIPTEQQGVLISLKVCADLLNGDLAKKFNEGSLGVSISSVMDTYNTNVSATGFEKSAGEYTKQFDRLLTIILTDATDTASAVFGQQSTSIDVV